MKTVRIDPLHAAEDWRAAARDALANGLPPDALRWTDGEDTGDLFGDAAPQSHKPATVRVPKSAVALCDLVACHNSPERFALLYTLVWRLQSERHLMADRTDPLMHRLRVLEKSVRRDIHKMHAFVRFQEVAPLTEGRRAFAAWFEPDHHIVARTASFFANRFGDMDWAIATPKGVSRYVGGQITVEPAGDHDKPPADETEELWLTYYANIFNPARLMVRAMTSEMPRKYWHNLPEARLIPGLIAGAEQRVKTMKDQGPTDAHRNSAKWHQPVKEDLFSDAAPETLDAAHKAAEACTRCPLHSEATQVVFGEGPRDAQIMFVGEQPGDKEDLSGQPFVGPAGQMLDELMVEAGVDRDSVYVTNVVKHFKFIQRGKRRIHQNPDKGEIDACKWWLDLERQLVRPRLLVALGGTATYALTGRKESILKRRGGIETAKDGSPVLITVHPSMILRIPDKSAAQAARENLRSDLSVAANWLRDQAA